MEKQYVNGNSRLISFNNSSKKSSGSFWYFGLIFTILFFIVLITTNPNKEAHVSAVSGVVKNYLNTIIESNKDKLFGLDALVGSVGSVYIDSQLSAYLKRDNYYLFSFTVLKYNNNEQWIGYGVLGSVYLFDEFGQELDKLYKTGANVVDVLKQFGLNSADSTNNTSSEYDQNNLVDTIQTDNSIIEDEQNPDNSESTSNYNNSPSSSYSNQNQQQIQISECTYCNGTGKCAECSKTFNKPFYKGNGSYEWRKETRPGLVMCNDCRGYGHKQVKRDEGGYEPGEDCYIRDCNDGWVACRKCNNYGNGSNIGQCKECEGSGVR